MANTVISGFLQNAITWDPSLLVIHVTVGDTSLVVPSLCVCLIAFSGHQWIYVCPSVLSA